MLFAAYMYSCMTWATHMYIAYILLALHVSLYWHIHTTRDIIIISCVPACSLYSASELAIIKKALRVNINKPRPRQRQPPPQSTMHTAQADMQMSKSLVTQIISNFE